MGAAIRIAACFDALLEVIEPCGFPLTDKGIRRAAMDYAPLASYLLNLILGTKLEHLDPQKISAATDANMSRLFTRTLTTFKSEPGAAASEIVGAKWTVLIVHDLSEGPRRFTALEHACEGISPRTLAERLRWLEAEGIVVRRSYAESPPRVEYQLTDKGQALLPIIDEMRRFGHDWLGCEVHAD